MASICGSSIGFGYNLDNFTGTIDPEIQEFQSVNNDGGISVNEPNVFRRIRCFEGPAPTDDVEPPPFQRPPAPQHQRPQQQHPGHEKRPEDPAAPGVGLHPVHAPAQKHQGRQPPKGQIDLSDHYKYRCHA